MKMKTEELDVKANLSDRYRLLQQIHEEMGQARELHERNPQDQAALTTFVKTILRKKEWESEWVQAFHDTVACELHSRKAWEKLVPPGTDPTALVETLRDAAEQLISMRRNSKMPFDFGMTRKVVKEFPARVRTMASEIERINRQPAWTPLWFARSSFDEWKALPEDAASRLQELPDTLRTYADYIGQWSKVLTKSPGRGERRPLPSFFDNALRRLIEKVKAKNTARRPHNPQIADLLTVATRVWGTEYSVTPDYLKMRFRPSKDTRPKK